MENKTLLEWALYYKHQKGWSILPLKGKLPSIDKWAAYQKDFATDEEIEEWFTNPAVTGMGILTGKLSGLVVLDLDLAKGADITGLELLPTVISKTGGGGQHHYYKFPQNGEIRNSAGLIREHIDIRGEGGYVVAPPSLHPNGNNYEWCDALSPGDVDMEEVPEWLLEKTTSPNETKKDFGEIIKGVGEGRRNESATSLIGKLLTYLPEKEWENLGWQYLLECNERNTPPLPIKEIRSVFKSIANKELQSRGADIKRERSKPFSVSDILAMTLEPQPFLVNGLVPERGLTAFSGQANGGKGWTTLHIAHGVATGLPIFGKFATKQGNVLIVDEEAGTAEFHRRMVMLGIKPEDKIYLYSQEEFKVDSSNDLTHLVNTAKELEIKLVIFDPFSAIHLKAENTADDMQKVMTALQQFNLAGIAVIFIHHHRKEHFMNRQIAASSGLRGSTVLFTRPDSHMAIKKDGENEDGLTISIEQTKLRGGQRIKPFTVELKIDKETNRASFVYIGEVEDKLVKKESAKEFILERLVGLQMTSDELIVEAKEANIGKNAIEDALKEMRIEKLVIAGRIKGRGKMLFYSLPVAEEVLDPEN